MLGIVRPIGAGLTALTMIFLVLGLVMGNDGLGLLFLVSLVAGSILIVVDIVRRRRGA